MIPAELIPRLALIALMGFGLLAMAWTMFTDCEDFEDGEL